MTKLTDKQAAFALNKAAGMKNRDAAISAGYAPNSADVTAAQLLRRADIKAAIQQGKKASVGRGGKAGDDQDEGDRKFKMPKASYTDAKEFLLDAMNHKAIPIAARAEYAKALLPYQHARIAEAGKKETKRANAKEAAKTGKFKTPPAPPARPVLHAVK